MKRVLLTAAVVALALAAAAPVIGAAGGAAAGPLLGSGTEDATVAIGRSHDGPVLTADALAPGAPATGSIRIWNDGTVPARMTLSADVRGDARLAGALQLRVTTAAGQLLYHGRLSELGHAALGTFAPGEGTTVDFRASLPAARAAAALDGRSLAAAFRWTAAQA